MRQLISTSSNGYKRPMVKSMSQKIRKLIGAAAISLLIVGPAQAYTTTYTCSYGSCTGRGHDYNLGGYRVESSTYGPTRIHTDSGNTYTCYGSNCYGGY